MAGRERMRIVLCEALSLHPFGKECSNEKITQAFRQSVQANFGEDGLGAFGGFGKVVINFTQFCGFFAIRVKQKYFSESIASLNLVISLNARPVSIRVIRVTGRMSNAVKAATEHLILWRNSLPQDYAVPRKEHLNKLVREAVSSLSAVPSYT
jgi:RNase P/RNase MRP subunit POP5